MYVGTTGDCICLVGDSAGATLAVSTVLRAMSYNVRLPDAVLSVYGCMLVKYAPSPSRLLSLMDPLLPLGVLPKCLAGMSPCQAAFYHANAESCYFTSTFFKSTDLDATNPVIWNS